MGKRKIMAKLEESVLSEAEALEIRKLLGSNGWELFTEMADEMYDVFYSKLAICKKDDEFYRIQGRLEAVEQILELPVQKLEIFNQSKS